MSPEQTATLSATADAALALLFKMSEEGPAYGWVANDIDRGVVITKKMSAVGNNLICRGEGAVDAPAMTIHAMIWDSKQWVFTSSLCTNALTVGVLLQEAPL